MPVIIVTKKCYLQCESVRHITIQEEFEEVVSEDGSGTIIPHWEIVVYFQILGGAKTTAFGGATDESSVMIKVGDREAAYKLFTEIVSQIRDQMPDQLYLDRLVKDFLAGGSLDEASINGKYEDIRSARKEKRRSEKVLRKSKKRN